MNTGWKEIAGDMLQPKLKDIYSQETSTWWKGHNNRIWFQIKDDVTMELDRIWYVEYKSRNNIETPHCVLQVLLQTFLMIGNHQSMRAILDRWRP